MNAQRHYRYLIVIEDAGANYSAYSPDLPGCIAVGDTLEETEASMHDAIEFHLEAMREHGDAIPEPRSRIAYHDHDEPAAAA